MKIALAKIREVREPHNSAAVLAVANCAVIVEEFRDNQIRGHAVLGEMLSISGELAKDAEITTEIWAKAAKLRQIP